MDRDQNFSGPYDEEASSESSESSGTYESSDWSEQSDESDMMVQVARC